ncbi:MAG: hypothetical protein Q7R66_05000 [Undibacterium sp.]|uniref:hypothetical protein n=1 Tax=Undibacterium sp. TaxID=1914977 RepID=UPI002725D6CB|nr:hypothetical protein [Undibacterium sp.]MDO8651527.1 hypothetical protein [Undibacterium sp.]
MSSSACFAVGFAFLPFVSLPVALTTGVGSCLILFATFTTLLTTRFSGVFITLGAITSFASSFFEDALTSADVTLSAFCISFAADSVIGGALNLDANLAADSVEAAFVVIVAIEDVSFFAGFFIALAIESNQQVPRNSLNIQKTMHCLQT